MFEPAMIQANDIYMRPRAYKAYNELRDQHYSDQYSKG